MIFTTDALVALLTLTLMEIVLGIDNIVFIAILVGRLPKHQQAPTRRVGLGLALISRLALLLSITWVMSLNEPILDLFEKSFSGRDLILIVGGLFLMGKATKEIHSKLEGEEHIEAALPGGGANAQAAGKRQLAQILAQLIVLDIVFSLDSVITAVGMAQQVWIMVAAMVTAVLVMLVFAGAIGDFVMKHPSVKILALAFLLMIGMTLLMDGMGTHVSKGYIYFAMAFSLAVELLNMRYRAKRKAKAVQLRF